MQATRELSPDVTLTSGRTIQHTRNANGSQQATPTTGPEELTPAEWGEYSNIVRDRAHWSNAQMWQAEGEEPISAKELIERSRKECYINGGIRPSMVVDAPRDRTLTVNGKSWRRIIH